MKVPEMKMEIPKNPVPNMKSCSHLLVVIAFIDVFQLLCVEARVIVEHKWFFQHVDQICKDLCWLVLVTRGTLFELPMRKGKRHYYWSC